MNQHRTANTRGWYRGDTNDKNRWSWLDNDRTRITRGRGT